MANMIHVFKVYLLIFLITGIIGIDLTNYQMLSQELENFGRYCAVKTFPAEQFDAFYLYNSSNQWSYNITVSGSSPVTLKVSEVETDNFFILESNSSLPFVGEFSAVTLGNDKIVVSLRTTSVGVRADVTINDKWEIFTLDPVTRAYLTQPISIPKSTDLKSFSDKLVYKNFPKKMTKIRLLPHYRTFDLEIKAFDEKERRSEVLKFTYDFADLSYYNWEVHWPFPGETLVLDDYTNIPYAIYKMYNFEWMWIGANPYKHLDLGIYSTMKNISNAPKSLMKKTFDKEIVTFCCGNDDNKRIIDCLCFDSSNNKKLMDASIELNEDLQKIFVQIIDAETSLVIWVEGSSKTGYKVKAQIIQLGVEWPKINVFNSRSKIESISYNQVGAIQFLLLTIRNEYTITKFSYRFVM